MNIITLILDYFYKIFYGLNSLDLLIIALALLILYACGYKRGYNAKAKERHSRLSAYNEYRRNH